MTLRRHESAARPEASSIPLPRVETEDAQLDGEWFYRFEFEDGTVTECPPELDEFHVARAQLVLPELDRFAAGKWPDLRCIDIASHEAWFGLQLAARGANEVLAVEVDPARAQRARSMVRRTAFEQVTVRECDLFELSPDADGQFDVVLFLGILYHLSDPVGALQLARSLTRGVCVVETQVARPVPPLDCLWGTVAPREGSAIAVVPADEGHAVGVPVALVPTLAALVDLLHAVGFNELVQAVATPDLHEQYRDEDRVVVFAWP